MKTAYGNATSHNVDKKSTSYQIFSSATSKEYCGGARHTNTTIVPESHSYNRSVCLHCIGPTRALAFRILRTRLQHSGWEILSVALWNNPFFQSRTAIPVGLGFALLNRDQPCLPVWASPCFFARQTTHGKYSQVPISANSGRAPWTCHSKSRRDRAAAAAQSQGRCVQVLHFCELVGELSR